MTFPFEPSTIDMIWTLMTAGVLLTAGVATLLALPWSNKDIARVDATFRAVGDITQDSLPLHTLG